MCYPVACADCGKITWDGCGLHVSSVMNSVDPADRCGCAPAEESPPRRGIRSLFKR